MNLREITPGKLIDECWEMTEFPRSRMEYILYEMGVFPNASINPTLLLVNSWSGRGSINLKSKWVKKSLDNSKLKCVMTSEGVMEFVKRVNLRIEKDLPDSTRFVDIHKFEVKTMTNDYEKFQQMIADAQQAECLKEKIKGLEKQIRDKDEEIKLFTEEIEDKDLKISELSSNNSQLTAEKQKLAKDLNAYENAPAMSNKYQQLLEGFGKIQVDMNRIQSEFFEAEKQLATARAAFNKAENDRKNTVNKLNALYKEVKSILQIITPKE